MSRLRRTTLVTLTLAALALTGCGGTTRTPSAIPASPVTTTSPVTPAGANTSPPAATAAQPPAAAGQPSGRHGGGRSTPPTAQLPASWPADVPLPPGAIQNSTSGPGHWSILLLTPGPTVAEHHAAVAFYQAAGFTLSDPSTLHRGPYRIVLVEQSRDHPDPATYLAIGLTRS
jgi:hypothetical protein